MGLRCSISGQDCSRADLHHQGKRYETAIDPGSFCPTVKSILQGISPRFLPPSVLFVSQDKLPPNMEDSHMAIAMLNLFTFNLSNAF